MKKKKGSVKCSVISGSSNNPYSRILKSEYSEQIPQDYGATDWIEPPLSRRGLETMVNESSILPQCIASYAHNIAGFGIKLRYIEESDEPSEEAVSEMERACAVLEALSADMDIKDVFELLIEARETYGAAYLEVIRGADGLPCQIDFIEDTPTVKKSRQDSMPIEVDLSIGGRSVKRRKRFCRFVQTVNGKSIYFKEFGDPRVMDLRTGQFTDEPLAPENQANEILEFKIGAKPYGLIRWIGQLLGVDGSRKAEGLNNNYFENGRHTPLMIILNGGSLSPESEAHLKEYMDDIRGENGQHKFILLETEPADNEVDMGETKAQPKIEIENLAPILQQDGLFQNYRNECRREVQSAFLLPDLYVGYTTDFNRATAQTAMRVTEQQVFQPERGRLEWIINNKLLADYGFKYVKAYFDTPDITNPDDIFKILTVCGNNGGLDPNKAKEIAYEAVGAKSEPYPYEWGDIPLQISQRESTEPVSPFGFAKSERERGTDLLCDIRDRLENMAYEGKEDTD